MLEPWPRPRWLERCLGTPTGRGVRVAVVDSGWRSSLAPGFAGVAPGRSFCGGSELDVDDRIGHGTACTASILNIAPDVRIEPVRIFDHELRASVGTLCTAIRWAVERGMDVVHLSLGTLTRGALVPLYAACHQAREANTIVIAAAHPAGMQSFPSAFDTVLSVGTGPFRSAFDFDYSATGLVECYAACGHEGMIASLERGLVPAPATSSFAAPNITGLVALLREVSPGAPLEEVRATLARLSIHSPVRGRPATAGPDRGSP